MSNFIFMAEWPELQEPAGEAESLLQADLRAACFYAPSTLFGICFRCDLVINRREFCVLGRDMCIGWLVSLWDSQYDQGSSLQQTPLYRMAHRSRINQDDNGPTHSSIGTRAYNVFHCPKCMR
jgi:hypothetical protein